MAILLFLFGLAMFLFAMHNLEAGIRLASGQGLKTGLSAKPTRPSVAQVVA